VKRPAVIDANVVLYYLLETHPFVEECQTFWRGVGAVCAPASWEAEVMNALWLAVRAKVLPEEEALSRLRTCAQLGIVSIAVRGLWEGALTRAVLSGHPPYDVVYVELAFRLMLPLVTFDRALLKRFPETAIRPRDFA